MESIITFLFGAAWGAMLFLVFRPAREEPPLIGQCLRVESGSVVLLEATSRIHAEQYKALRKYLDGLESHTGAKFAVIDGAFRVAAIRSSE